MKLVSATINYGSRTAGQYDLVRDKAIIIPTKYPGHKTRVNGLTLTNLLIQTARPHIIYFPPSTRDPPTKTNLDQDRKNEKSRTGPENFGTSRTDPDQDHVHLTKPDRL